MCNRLWLAAGKTVEYTLFPIYTLPIHKCGIVAPGILQVRLAVFDQIVKKRFMKRLSRVIVEQVGHHISAVPVRL
jgi:hypothetical protein